MLTGILTGMVYALVAMGFVLIYKCSKVINLAHGSMILVGAYICWTFAFVLGLPVWVAILLSLIFGAIVGLVAQRLLLRPLLGQPILALVMITIALSEIIRGGVITIWGAVDPPYVELLPMGIVSLGQMNISLQGLYGAAIASVVLTALLLFFRHGRWGLAMRGIAEGHQIVRSMGVSVNAMVALTWALAGIVAVLGGVVLGSLTGITLLLHEVGLKAIPAAFIGGLDSLEGAVVGGLAIGVMEALASGYIGHGLGLITAFSILIIVMFFRPYGLWGLTRIERV